MKIKMEKEGKEIQVVNFNEFGGATVALFDDGTFKLHDHCNTLMIVRNIDEFDDGDVVDMGNLIKAVKNSLKELNAGVSEHLIDAVAENRKKAMRRVFRNVQKKAIEDMENQRRKHASRLDPRDILPDSVIDEQQYDEDDFS